MFCRNTLFDTFANFNFSDIMLFKIQILNEQSLIKFKTLNIKVFSIIEKIRYES